MKLITIVSLCCLFTGSVVSAKSELNLIQRHAAAIMLKKAESKSLFENLPNDCQPPTGTSECVQYVGGSYPSADERLKAARACAGVYGLECVQYVGGSYPSFAERETAARSCAGVNGAKCVQYVAGSYPSTSERQEAAVACRYADVDCVKQVAGSYPSFAERIAAAKACGGN